MTASPAGLALSFVEVISGLDTPESVLAAFSKAASEFGFSTVALGELPRPSSDEIPDFFLSNWPQFWFDAYVGECLVASDPPWTLPASVVCRSPGAKRASVLGQRTHEIASLKSAGSSAGRKDW